MFAVDRFVTERLLAERLRPSDFDDIFRMNQTVEVMRLVGGVRSADATREYLKTNLEHWERHGFGLWILRAKADGAFAGRSVLRRAKIVDNDETEFGYALMPPYWGVGLATEISRAMLEIAFSRLQLSDVVALIAPNHAASRRVTEKVGGRHERDVMHVGTMHGLYRVTCDAYVASTASVGARP